jgi:hypothetical protein
VLSAVIALSFLAMVIVSAQSRSGPPSDVPDTRSSSALGHRALVALLEEAGHDVLVSGHASGARAGRDGVLVLLEPDLRAGRGGTLQDLQQLLRATRRVLLVLPKWRSASDAEFGWVSHVEPLLVSVPDLVLDALPSGGSVRRVAEKPRPALRVASAALDLPLPELGPIPLQLVRGGDLEPLVAAEQGVLVAELRDRNRHVVVLSDPDVVSNAGLHRGSNALLALRLVERLRDGRGTVVIDETLHGWTTNPSLAQRAVTPPVVFPLAHAAAVLLVLLACASARFGAARPPPPPFEPGTATLVRTTAELLRTGGHAQRVLPRYVAAVVEDVRAGLHASSGLEGAELDAWLDRVGAVRRVEERIAALRDEARHVELERATAAGALALAVRVDRWRREMLHARD